MNLTTQTVALVTAAALTATLPENAARVISVVGLAGAATAIDATNYPVVSGAPTAGQVQFIGTTSNASDTLTFEADLTANGLLLVTYVPEGALPSAV